jgi:hypothetical protein
MKFRRWVRQNAKKICNACTTFRMMGPIFPTNALSQQSTGNSTKHWTLPTSTICQVYHSSLRRSLQGAAAEAGEALALIVADSTVSVSVSVSVSSTSSTQVSASALALGSVRAWLHASGSPYTFFLTRG